MSQPRYNVWEVSGEGEGAAWTVLYSGLTIKQAQHKAQELSKRIGSVTYVVIETAV